MAKQIRMSLVIAILAMFLATSAWAETTSADAEATTSDDSEASTSSSSSSSSSTSSQSSSGSSGSSGLAGALSKLTIHGYLTQAYGTANFLGGRLPLPDGTIPGPTTDEFILGIPDDGTFDYRTMALQFRYEISPKDVMVVQFSSRSLGDSPINAVEDDVELDWAFYERRLADNTSIKVGRVQIPLGIFNEIRDVGTILPFYRPPFVFYREGTFTSETVDGVAFSHSFAPESDWNLDLDLYLGNWDSFELNFFDQSITLAKNEGYGFQLWLNTPVSGLRFGLGGHTRKVTEGAEGTQRQFGAESEFDDWYASVDGVFDRWVFRAEYREFEGDPEVIPAFFNSLFEGTIVLYYGQVGFHFTEDFRIYLQAEVNENKDLTSPAFTQSFDVEIRTDVGIALNYLITPSLVLKAEYHEVDAEDIGFLPVFGPTGLRFQPLTASLDTGDYSILSLSVSF